MKKFKDKLSRYLEPISMGQSIEKELSGIDLGASLGNISTKRSEKLFLRTFNREDLYEILKKVKLLQHLKKMGMDDIQVDIDVDESYINHLKVYFKDIAPDNLLLDLRLSESKFLPDKKFFKSGTDQVTYDMIVIEWLSAQNPYNNFKGVKPQLPGQKRPGLGVLKYCFEMMYVVAREIIKDGFLDIPDHLHGAIMYARKFKFFDPVHEGVLRAIMRDLKDYSLADISWGIITETIIEEYKNKPQPYDPSEQIFYVSDRLRKYFHSSQYKSTYKKYYKRKSYRFEYEEMKKKREQILKAKSIENL